MRVCPNCGNPLGGLPRYCAGCATEVSPEHERTSEPLVQAAPAFALPARTPVPAWALDDPPPPWVPGDPGRAAREPSRDPGESPWPAGEPYRPGSSPPPWMSTDVPWAPSDAPWPTGSPPWAIRTRPAPGAPAGTDRAGTDQAGTDQAGTDQATAVMAGYRGASPPAGPGRAHPWRWPRLSPGRGMTVTAMVTAVALLVTGGVAVWQVGQMRSRLPATNTSLAMPGVRADRQARSPGGHTPARAPATGPPTTGPAATGPAADHGTVRIAPAAAGQPHVNQVVTVLDSYFSAINRHDFQAYSSLFIPAIRVSPHNFGAGFHSTRDSRATLTGLATTGPQGLAAMVTFVSHQNPAHSPDHAACDRWHVTLFLKHGGGGYHIRRHQPGFPADTVRPCR